MSAPLEINDAATTLDRLVGGACDLYSLPAVAVDVLELTADPELDTRALKECIENDPALTSKILRVVNSSLFGLSGEVSDLSQALSLLGIKPLKLLVLGFSLPAGLFVGLEAEVLGHYWEHTLTKAVAGREISETLFKVPGDDAFIAGLLQDLGMLLLIQRLGRPYVEFLEKAAAGDGDLLALETEAMGFDHTTLSARLLAQWKLPETLVQAVAWESEHRRCGASGLPEKPLAQILHLAEMVARLLADNRPGVLGKLLAVGRKYKDLSEAQLELMVCDLVEKVQQLAEVLSLQLPGDRDYRDILARAHQQLSAVAAETAGDLLRCQQGQSASGEDQSLREGVQRLAEAVARASQQPQRSARPSVGAVHAAPQQAVGPPHQAEAKTYQAPGLTLLEPDPGLLSQLSAAVAACRQSRCSLSLLLVQLSCIEELTLTLGVEGCDHLRGLLQSICAKIDHPRATCIQRGEDGFALILPGCERRRAVELGGGLLREFRRLAPGSGERVVGIGAGVATVALPPKNFPAQDLLAGADRCLYGSLASGGVVKSIETY
jgi:HD-like signal output (HDOD) protein/GGDEF domain-containing protein